MDIRLRRDDLDKLLNLVESGQIRDANACAGTAFVSRFAVSDIGDQHGTEPGISYSNGNTILTAFGQYFDRGLDAAGEGADVAAVLGQSQAYGSDEAITNLLRKWTVDGEGNAVMTAYLLGGAMDGSGRAQLPTLDHIRANYRIMSGGQELTSDDIQNFDGTGQPLLRDPIESFKSNGELDLDALGHHFVAGDGGANGAASPIYTIWNRNHNQWVDRLKAETNGTWSEDEYFEAARIINVAEYQRVVFTEFAEALSQPSGGGHAAFDGFDPRGAGSIGGLDASILSLLPSEKVSFVDKVTGETKQVSLADTFLGQGNGISIDGAGQAGQPLGGTGAMARASVHPFLDLTELASVRDRDRGTTSFNQLRAELFVLTGLASLRPYDSWADFQARNSLSDDVVADIQAAYPEGIDAMDVWVGGLAEAPGDGQLGSTLGWLVRDEIDRLHEDGFRLDHLDGLPLQAELDAQSFSDIIMRNTGLADLPEKIFLADSAELATAIHLSDGDDIFSGTDGDDVIFGHGGNDEIFGGAGNDRLYGDGGATEVETGEDAVPDASSTSAETTNSTTSEAADAVASVSVTSMIGNLQVGTPPPANDAAPPDHDNDAGDASRDALVGGDDVLYGGGGNDELYAGGGSDILIGGSGNDLLMGEQGDDDLSGGTGEDLLSGGSGDDTLSGGAGADQLYGGSGGDSLAGGTGADTLVGGSGSDTLSGGSEADSLSGGSGNDTLSGGAGNDALAGGLGEDSLYGGAGSDALAGGEGNDWLSGGNDDEASLGGLTITGTAGTDQLAGGAGADSMTGGAGADSIHGGSGSDALSGGSGTDTLDGGDDADTVDGGSGDDQLSGGRGSDTLWGSSGNDHLYGGSGNDYLDGGSGNDTLEGGSGSNIYNGGSGDDWIISVSGSDTIVLQPGFGNDYVSGFDADSSGAGGQTRIDVSAYGFAPDSLGTDILVLALGDDTVISIGSDTLTLLSVNAQTIDRNDFIFS